VAAGASPRRGAAYKSADRVSIALELDGAETDMPQRRSRSNRCSAARANAVPDRAEVAADPYLASHLTGRPRVRLLIPSFTDSTGACLAPEYVLADFRSAAIDGLIERLTASGAYTLLLRATPYAVLRAVGPPKVSAAVCSQ
jgi:hypothetical protein